MSEKNEKVETLCLACGETLARRAFRIEQYDMRPCCPDSNQVDVFLAPPDQTERIEELERRVAI